MRVKIIKSAVAIIVVLAIIGGGYFAYTKYTASRQTNSVVKYAQAVVKKDKIAVSIQATGNVFGAVTKDVISNNSGEIRDLGVKPGDMVTQGNKVCLINNEQLKQNVSQAQMDVESLKVQLSKYKTQEEIDLQNLKIADAERKLTNAKEQVNKMTVYAPISGLVVAKNNDNGDNIQSGKSIISIVDTSVMKIKIPVDELDIAKVKIGQAAFIKFGAIKDKNYEGTVETIAQSGSTSNNVTTYDVVVAIKDPQGLKLGMNGNVTINVEVKDNVLTIPIEALIERNGAKYVLIQDGTATQKQGANNVKNKTNKNGTQDSAQSKALKSGQNTKRSNAAIVELGEGAGKLVEVKTGLENENYIEIVEGLKEGDILLIVLPQSTTTGTNGKSQNNGQGKSLFPTTTIKQKNNNK